MTGLAFGYLILISIDFYDFSPISVSSLGLVSIEKIHQTLKTVFDLHVQTPGSSYELSGWRRVLTLFTGV